jgi:hypothetical protein
MGPAMSQLVLPGTIDASVTNFQPDDGSRNFSFLQEHGFNRSSLPTASSGMG